MQCKISQAVITWEAAHLAVAAAVEHATNLGVRVSAAVCDSGGNLSAFLRMPGAPLHTVRFAQDKAYTSVSFPFATSQWATEITKHPEEVRHFLRSRERLITVGGGVPIDIDGEIVGAIGVSGASADEDDECARHAVARLTSSP